MNLLKSEGFSIGALAIAGPATIRWWRLTGHRNLQRPV